jgi:hypothetical protein
MEVNKLIAASDGTVSNIDFLVETLESDLKIESSTSVSDNRQKEINGEIIPEPLLYEDKKRLCLFPITRHDVSCKLALAL